MAKRRKKATGFNAPFADLPLTIASPAPDQREPSGAPSPDSLPPEASDAELFSRAVEGVQPLVKTGQRIEPAKLVTANPTDDEALALLELESIVQGKGHFEVFDSEEQLVGRAPGVSNELLSRLQAGAFSFRRSLDLHGLSRDEARSLVVDFVSRARREGERCVLIVTGRGKSSPLGVSVLRETLPRWLSRSPLRSHVLAFCSARRADGGPGAFYVLLRRPGTKPYGLTS